MRSVERVLGKYRKHPRIFRGKLGLPDGTVLGNRSNYHWVRLFGKNNAPIQAYNNVTKPTPNLDVYVMEDEYRTGGIFNWRVIGTVASAGTAMAALIDEQSKDEEISGDIARSLEWSEQHVGRNALNVHERAIVPLRVQALPVGEMRVYVNPGYYMYAMDGYKFFTGAYTDTITAPVAGERFDLVYLDSTDNTVGVATGTAATGVTDLIAPPALPSEGCIPLGYVQVNESSTAIDEKHIFDMRPFLTCLPSIADHDHSGDAGDGGMLEANDALKVTGGTTGHVLTVQSDDTIAAQAVSGGITDKDTVSATGSTTTTSSSYADLNAMSLTVTVPASGNVLLQFAGRITPPQYRTVSFQFLEGSTALTPEYGCQCDQPSIQTVSFHTLLTGVSSGDHTYKVQWKTSAGTATCVGRRMTAIVW